MSDIYLCLHNIYYANIYNVLKIVMLRWNSVVSIENASFLSKTLGIVAIIVDKKN